MIPSGNAIGYIYVQLAFHRHSSTSYVRLSLSVNDPVTVAQAPQSVNEPAAAEVAATVQG